MGAASSWALESLSMVAAVTEVALGLPERLLSRMKPHLRQGTPAHSNCNHGHFHTVAGSDSLTVCGPRQKSSRDPRTSKWCAEHVGSG